MLWAILAATAGFLWSVGNIIDKKITDSYSQDAWLITGIERSVFIIPAIALFLFMRIDTSAETIFLGLVAALLGFVATAFYFKSINLEEVSRVIPVFSFSPIIVMVLAFFFLGEVFGAEKYLGIFLVVFGSLLISMKKGFKFRHKKAFFFILFATFLFSINLVVFKWALLLTDYWSFSAWVFLFYGLCGVVLVLSKKSVLHKADRKLFVVSPLSGSIGVIATFLLFISLSLGPVTLVEAILSAEYVFVFLMAVFMSAFFPHILKEEVDRRTLGVKLLATLIIIAGSVLVI